MDNYVRRVNAYLDTFLAKEGYELLKTEFVKEDGNFYLRVYIDLLDKEGFETAGDEAAEAASDPAKEAESEQASDEAMENTREISINDCAQVSRRLSKWLDKEDFIKEAYMLEVCSRGFLKDEGASD